MTSRVLHVPAQGTPREVHMDQRDASRFLGGQVTFVGALPHLNVVLVGRACTEGLAENAHLRTLVLRGDAEDGVPQGDVLCIGSDEDGEACDVDVDAVRAALNLGPPSAGDPASCR